MGHTHGSNTNKRRAHTGVEASSQTIAGNTLADNIDSGRIDTALGGLEADLDEIKGVADNDGANATEAASGEGADLLSEGGRGRLGFLLGLLRDEREVLDDGRENRVGGVGGRHCGGEGGRRGREKQREDKERQPEGRDEVMKSVETRPWGMRRVAAESVGGEFGRGEGERIDIGSSTTTIAAPVCSYVGESL